MIEIGKKYGKLTILEKLKYGQYRYKCDCGNEGTRKGYTIEKTKYPTCGCGISEGVRNKKVQSIVGTIKNNCRIVRGWYKETKAGKTRLFVDCECLKCHNTFEIRYDTLNHLHGENCPQCNIKANGERHKKPHRDSKLWRIWWGIKTRCYKESNKMYHHYGGRGIKMCDDWLNSYESFYDWAINNGYGQGLSIDRIDNDGNYEPLNCRWVDQKTQCNNTRRIFYLWYNNKWRQVDEIAKMENISYDIAYYKYVTKKSTRLPKKMLYNIDKITK